MSDWLATTFGSLGHLFDGPHATPTRRDNGPYFLNIASLDHGRLDLSMSDHVSQDDFVRWTKRVVPKSGDLLFSYETRLGDAALMPANVEACLGRRMALLRPDRTRVEPRFLLYYYLSPQFQATIERHTIHGATVNRIALSTIGRWDVSLPPLGEQRAIAEVLGALDDKIAANNLLESTITDLANARFATAVGGQTQRVPFRDLIFTTKGVSYKSADLNPSATALVTLKSFIRTGGYTTSGLKPYTGPYKASQVVAPGELVVAQTDLTQAAEVVGRAVQVPRNEQYETLVASLDLVVVRPQSGVENEFVLGVMLEERFRDHCKSHTSGTTVLHLDSDAILSYGAPRVSAEVRAGISRELHPMFAARDALVHERRALAATRDALLPALMSGRLRVRDAERVVSASV